MIRARLLLVAGASALALSGPALAREPDPVVAADIFSRAQAICERDGGALWGRSLCGPILLVDYRDRGVIANQADAEGHLTADGAVFRGTLPDAVIIANTPTEWAGVRWTQLVAEFPEDSAGVDVLIAHELFHRIQPELGLSRSAEGGNRHLDTLEGRYLLQLEWRALEAALRAETPAIRAAAVADALALRQARYRLFRNAAVEEAAMETNEGVPEYTGVRLGLTSAEARTAFAIQDLSAFLTAPTFVRSFAYATGPAYGLLLDEATPDWRARIGDEGQSLSGLLGAAYGQASADQADLAALTARYDDGALRMAEVARDEARRARLADYRARLIDGPILTLPLARRRVQFNPQTLVPLEGVGMIYPTMGLIDRWGSLTVESGGALLLDNPRQANIPATGAAADGLSGAGWRLTLSPGWAVEPGERPGDLRVVCRATCD